MEKHRYKIEFYGTATVEAYTEEEAVDKFNCDNADETEYVIESINIE